MTARGRKIIFNVLVIIWQQTIFGAILGLRLSTQIKPQLSDYQYHILHMVMAGIILNHIVLSFESYVV